jgi:XTP/dITP diphosphohydrolase
MVNSRNDIIYLATNNAHKAEEFSKLAEGRFKFLPARELRPGISWVEDGKTFLDNARIKARELAKYTTSPILADDSGLMVDILNGEPGVFSSRYCGTEGDDLGNMNKLLKNLRALPKQKFEAKFVCCLWYIADNGSEHTFTGECPGEIVLEPRGNQGFGYDPVFQVEGTARTLAEMHMEEKNLISHRFQAFKQWLTWRNANGN